MKHTNNIRTKRKFLSSKTVETDIISYDKMNLRGMIVMEGIVYLYLTQLHNYLVGWNNIEMYVFTYLLNGFRPLYKNILNLIIYMLDWCLPIIKL